MHRKHASVYDVATLLPHYCGDLVRDELDVLRRLTGEPERPYVVVLGGSKVSDKLAVIDSLLPKVDQLLVGGGMCFTFLAAQGHEVGDSLLEADQIETCARLLAEAGDKIVLPTDIVVAAEISDDAPSRRSSPPTRSRPAEWGSTSGRTRSRRSPAALAGAQTVFWNGPMGVFESRPFAAGTRGCRRGGRGDRRAHRRRRRRLGRRRPRARAWTRTRSGTSPPAAVRRWSSSRARRCPVSTFSKRR